MPRVEAQSTYIDALYRVFRSDPNPHSAGVLSRKVTIWSVEPSALPAYQYDLCPADVPVSVKEAHLNPIGVYRWLNGAKLNLAVLRDFIIGSGYHFKFDCDWSSGYIGSEW